MLPLSKKLNEGAEKVFAELSKYYNCEFDDRGNIGKRYRRQDEIGTPFCVTYDFDSEEDGAVTVRDRDTMEQERVKIEDLKAYFEKKLSGKINKESPDCSSQVSLWIQFGLFLYNFKIAWKIEQEENDMDRKNGWTTYSKEELTD